MYLENDVTKMPEHESMAIEIASDILKRFSALEQNEMLISIRRLIKESRISDVDKCEKDLNHAKEMLNLIDK